ncbi:Glycogen-binding domain-containing protein [Sulfidibacter corallicola]|uniref:Glycogen-binding domain-containing protein n=1 Tax=Sulfidibacter corallicola TaxID=2818388 RepID=A0A8A4TSF2_SULCO|nr:glycogen-binding domain-containing protein [Sulfidibacter corallicola]QTD51982.1 glycogen-binding domain-containing protein [Sulfidibacter corallicola]
MAKAAVAKKKKVTLSFDGEPGVEVKVAGSFNEWSLDDKKKSKVMKEDKAGHYSINLFLPLGEHEYKFYSNGEWILDPKVEVKKLNRFGTFNGVITVG